jgi:hypothetical protein
VLKEGATQLDLGNVQFTKNDREWVSQVHLVIAQGNCEMSESEALPVRDDDLNSVSIHAFLVEQMIPLFMKKYEAIDTRKRSLNELRQVARGALSQQKIRISPGKVRDVGPTTRGRHLTVLQSLERLIPENDRDGSAANGMYKSILTNYPHSLPQVMTRASALVETSFPDMLPTNANALALMTSLTLRRASSSIVFPRQSRLISSTTSSRQPCPTLTTS